VAEKKVPIEQRPAAYSRKPRRRAFDTVLALKILLIAIFLLLLIGGVAVAAVVFNYVKEAPPFDSSQLATVETSYIYDSEGNEIAVLHEEQNRIVVKLNQIPQHVQEAFIAIEDERFFKHFGFDLTGSLRAAYINFRAGEIVQGASTITQQLAQNAFLTTDKTYRRKIQEIWLALQLERIYGKEEILEMYLNRIYFGNGAYGVEAASQTYFDKGVADLSLAEAAMLAGAVRSPNYYNPFDNLLEAEARMWVVLANMSRLNLITENQFQTALQEQLNYALPQSPEYAYPFFVDYVVHHELIKILSALPGIDSRQEAYQMIYTGGLRVYTTLEPNLQLHVEEVLSRTNLYPTTIYVDLPRVREAVSELPSGRDLTWGQLQELMVEEGGVAQPQAAIVVADPTTGKIKALGGGRDYRKKIDEILRFTTLRQPGSAIKPIIAYAPAFNEGVLAGAGSTLDDSPFTGPQGWKPKNFDNRFRGPISAREALYFSYNVPAVRLFQALSPRVGVSYAQKMGISTITPEEIDNLSLTLGGFTRGVSAIDMAQAYSVLANSGVKVDLYTVEKIVDPNGRVLYEQFSDPQQILSSQAAFLVNDILQDFVTKYLGRALQIDRPVAAKTGTTENWKDVYLVAYTPNLVASFWMGYDEPKMGSIQQGWRYSTAFLREVFLEAFKDLEIRNFNRPDGIVRMEICSVSGLRPNDLCRAAGTVSSDYFIARFAPNWLCDYHLDLLPIPDDPIVEDPEEPEPEEPVDPDPGEPDPGEPDPPEEPPVEEPPPPTPPSPNPEPPQNWWERFGN
jgi:penicillin-binding protein 1A